MNALGGVLKGAKVKGKALTSEVKKTKKKMKGIVKTAVHQGWDEIIECGKNSAKALLESTPSEALAAHDATTSSETAPMVLEESKQEHVAQP